VLQLDVHARHTECALQYMLAGVYIVVRTAYYRVNLTVSCLLFFGASVQRPSTMCCHWCAADGWRQLTYG
jgi:hypothetical protein